jgi:hypothetical protein
VPIILREVLMQIGQLKFKTKIGWALIEDVPLLLGRENVF